VKLGVITSAANSARIQENFSARANEALELCLWS